MLAVPYISAYASRARDTEACTSPLEVAQEALVGGQFGSSRNSTNPATDGSPSPVLVLGAAVHALAVRSGFEVSLAEDWLGPPCSTKVALRPEFRSVCVETRGRRMEKGLVRIPFATQWREAMAAVKRSLVACPTVLVAGLRDSSHCSCTSRRS